MLNCFKVFGNKIFDENIQNPFCQNKYSKSEVCKNFIVECVGEEKSESYTCPYGYNCTKGMNSFICGYLVRGRYDKGLMRYRKIVRGLNVQKISIDQERRLGMNIKISDFCDVCSETIHEMKHFCSQVKSLVEQYNTYNLNDKRMDDMIVLFLKYVEIVEEYVSIKEEFEIKTLNYDLSNYEHKMKKSIDLFKIYEKYLGLIEENINDLNNLKRENNNIELEYDMKGISIVRTFFALQSLIELRMKYFLSTAEEFINKKNNVRSENRDINFHKVAKKLEKTFVPIANNKKVSICFNGSTFKKISCNENVVLAMYILFENAVKYSPMNSTIEISFFDDTNRNISSFEITNESKPIGEKNLSELTKKGVSGDNKVTEKSTGLGLFIVSKILEKNKIDYSFDYKDNRFAFKISANSH